MSIPEWGAESWKIHESKGFFAINVQNIVDKKKRILWQFIGQKGSSHDSSVFKQSDLYKHLMLLADNLYDKNLYIVGDSVYGLRNFLLWPDDNVSPGSKEGYFNFFLFSQQIHVEWTFSEIDRRFGIFWKALEGNLKSHKFTIDAS